MILSSKVLGANGLSCLCRSSLWLHTPVLRPYPILKNKMNIFCHMYSMLPFPLLDKYWVYSYCSNYYRAKWIVFNHSKYLENFVFGLLECHYFVSKNSLDFYIANSFPIKSLFDRIIWGNFRMATENQHTIHWMPPVITQLWMMNLTEFSIWFHLVTQLCKK
jgi:hypothetical protein